MTGSGTDASSYPCLYCFVKFEKLPTGSHCKLESVKNTKNRLRNYDDALLANTIYRENCKKDENGKRTKCAQNDKMGKSEIVASQVNPPNVYLEGPENYLSIIPPDSLHWWLNCNRVNKK